MIAPPVRYELYSNRTNFSVCATLAIGRGGRTPHPHIVIRLVLTNRTLPPSHDPNHDLGGGLVLVRNNDAPPFNRAQPRKLPIKRPTPLAARSRSVAFLNSRLVNAPSFSADRSER